MKLLYTDNSMLNAHSLLIYFQQEHFFCSVGGQSGYIQDKLKNIRRTLPPSAKQKTSSKNITPPCCESPKEDLIPESEAEELESYCRNATGGRTRLQVIRAMERLAPNRRAWIDQQKPFLSKILYRYPRFMDIPELVSQT